MQSNSIEVKQAFSTKTREGAFSMTFKAVYRIAAKAMLFLATVVTFLSAGFFYGWQVGPIPGFRILDDMTYIQAMNAVNANIPNPGFSFIFVGSLLFMLIALVMHIRQWRNIKFILILLAILTYVFGLVFVTFGVHVPLNEALLQHTDITSIDVASIRSNYESRWNRWHVYRTFAVVVSAVLMLSAVTFETKEAHK